MFLRRLARRSIADWQARYADDLFLGYLPEDIARVEALMVRSKPHADAYTDAFGVRLSPDYCPWIAKGRVETAAPFPRDSYLADGIEYASVAMAFEAAQDRSVFTAVELGSGWGPWVSLSGLLAERQGYREINLVAFEAEPARYEQLLQHLALNGIEAPRYRLQLHAAAAWHQNETLYWPASRGAFDAGMAVVSGETPSSDYRGLTLPHVPIPGVSIIEALSGYPVIDFLHIDIQGGEYELIRNTRAFLSERSRSMFIGTHDRKIEGDLIALLRDAGWLLRREKPCQFNPYSPAPTLTGQTLKDGGQFWQNPRLL